MMGMRAVIALCAGFVVLVAVATLTRPEPGPCGGTNDQGKQTLMLCSPLADTRLVLASAAAATLLTWVGAGLLQRRLVPASLPGQGGTRPGRTPAGTRVRTALVAAAAGAAGAAVVAGGVRVAGDHRAGLADCGSRGPTGPTPCRYQCDHSIPLGAPDEAANAPCVYDPTGEIFPTSTTVAGTPLPPGAVTPPPVTTR